MTSTSEGYRAFSGNVADVQGRGDRHTVTFEFPHEVIDGYNTDFGQRCFDESLRRLLPPMLWQHLMTEPIGRAESYESTGRRTIIHNRFSDFSAVPRAEQAFVQLRDGDIPGVSFHFRNARSVPHPRARSGRRYIKADMIETSPVSFPAIPGTTVTNVRGLLDAPRRGAELGILDEIDEALERFDPERRVQRARGVLADVIESRARRQS